ncbi:hypothetical protein PIB30_092193 [Stylosanthes scabra]|uniref:Uncharacterized protein n=1 Tax=Stylosanthes scabra TaxID=79078 RepID=A0ABU6QU66_9FABA|nr:hypothetical protein [Stylosanthes scabra]
MSGTEWKKWEGNIPAEFSPNNSAVIEPTHFLPSLAITFEGTLIEPPSEPPFPRRRHSPSSPHPNLRSPAIVFSVTGSRGEGSIENHEDPHLGNGAVDHTLAVRVSWRRRGDVVAATTTVEPLPSFLAAPSSPSFLAASSSGPVTPSHPLFNFNCRSRHKAQFSPSSTPLNVSSLLRCSTTVTEESSTLEPPSPNLARQCAQ